MALSTELDGIVVAATDLGDSDRIVRLLTAARGRVSIVVRRARSKGGGATGLGTVARAVVGQARDGLFAAKSLEALGGPVRARDSLLRIALLSWGCELCGALAPEGAPADKLHGLLTAWLSLLEGPREPTAAHRLALEAKACTFAGFSPRLVVCAACGGAVQDPVVFDADAGGAVHGRCGGGRAVSARGLHALEDLRRTPLAEVEGATPPVPAYLLTDFAEHHLGRPLRARALLSAATGGG